MDAKTISLNEFYGGTLDPDDDVIDAAISELPAPRTPEILLEKLVALGAGPDDLILDLGCGHGQYTQQIAAATGGRVIALDFSGPNVAETRDVVRDAEVARVLVSRGTAEALPLAPGSLDYIWCRDMLYHVDLGRTLSECRAALRPGGQVVVYHSFATELMEPLEAQRLYGATGVISAAENMDPAYFERTAAGAGFAIVERDVVGGEWRESWEAEGGSRNTSKKLLRAAQLIRHRDQLSRVLGEKLYAVAMADQLWGVYQMLGKLRPTIYVLRRR